MAVNRWCFAAGLAWLALVPAARGQGVAFQPVVGAIPNGPTLGVTPAVSIDRRYVRLGVNPQFIGVEGFNTFLVPGAVGGGPGGPGGGGLGLGAVGGGQFRAGMDGIISPAMESGFDGVPPGYGFAGNQGWVDVAPEGFAAIPAGPQTKHVAVPRAGASKIAQRGKNSRA